MIRVRGMRVPWDSESHFGIFLIEKQEYGDAAIRSDYDTVSVDVWL